MSKGIIYYTDNRLPEPLFSTCQRHILASGLPIISVSLKPLAFGHNIVLADPPGYISMVNQIITALENSSTHYVFFCEHDVLYHPSHFDFTPPRDDTYYYNLNNWRWAYPTDIIIRYDGLTSLSQLCVSRNLALTHFTARKNRMREIGLDKFQVKDPRQARVWGYEPGRKKLKNGAFMEERCAYWSSSHPNIDIRHNKTFSLRKVARRDFFHPPTGWIQSTIGQIPGWNLKELQVRIT